MPPQRRLAMSRVPPGNVARLPNLDGSVATAAGNLFSIRTQRHAADPEIVRSQDTNQQKQRGKNLGRKNLEKTPGQRALVPVISFSNSFLIFLAATRKRTILCILDLYIVTIYLSKKVRFSSGLSR